MSDYNPANHSHSSDDVINYWKLGIPPQEAYDYFYDLDNKMQDLYDRMGWGKYNFPIGASNTAIDINRVLEAEQSFMDEIYGYNTRQITTTIKKTFSNKRDPARPRVNKHL